MTTARSNTLPLKHIRKSSSGTSVSAMIRQPSSFLGDGVIWEASPAWVRSSLTGYIFLFISVSFFFKNFVRHSLPLQGRHKDTNIIPINQENNATTMPLPVRQVTLALPFIIYFALYIIIVNTSDTPIIEPTMIITGMMLS